MACSNICKLCDNLIISSSVTFTGGNLVINIPTGNYGNCCKYCIVVAQTIPTTTTITAPVYITIGDETTLYPLVDKCCAQLIACQIKTRTRYSTTVSTNATGGSFRLLGNIKSSGNHLPSLPAPETTTEIGG